MPTFEQRHEAAGPPLSEARKEAIASDLRRNYPRAEPHFEAHWPKYFALAGAFILSSLVISAYNLRGFDVAFMYTQGALLIGAILYLFALYAKFGFKLDPDSNSGSARHPLAAIFGMAGGVIYTIISLDLGLTELMAVDWIGEVFVEAGKSGEPSPVSWAMAENMAFGAEAFLALSVYLAKQNKDA